MGGKGRFAEAQHLLHVKGRSQILMALQIKRQPPPYHQDGGVLPTHRPQGCGDSRTTLGAWPQFGLLSLETKNTSHKATLQLGRTAHKIHEQKGGFQQENTVCSFSRWVLLASGTANGILLERLVYGFGFFR